MWSVPSENVPSDTSENCSTTVAAMARMMTPVHGLVHTMAPMIAAHRTATAIALPKISWATAIPVTAATSAATMVSSRRCERSWASTE